jgi:hypothetical protein
MVLWTERDTIITDINSFETRETGPNENPASQGKFYDEE